MQPRVLALGLAWAVLGCGEVSSRNAPPGDAGALANLPWAPVALPPVPCPEDNPASEDKRALGRLLFYDPVLSGDRATACVTCHSELWGLGDQLPRSVGVEGRGPIGPGRRGPHMTRRNAQTLWNVAYRERLFWDGRSGSLEAQALFPLESPEELNRAPSHVVKELRTIPAYVALFARAFPEEREPVSERTLARALASFVRAYTSDGAPYDQYLRGDALALYDEDLRGMAVFAELGCHECHVPPRFESERYEDRHVPNPELIADLGRAAHTGRSDDHGRFRVPTLRNVRATGPYFHNGSVATLEAAVAHEVGEQVALGRGRVLDDHDMSDLVSFLRRSLVDMSREQFPPSAVPSGLPIPKDGDRLVRGVHDTE